MTRKAGTYPGPSGSAVDNASPDRRAWQVEYSGLTTYGMNIEIAAEEAMSKVDAVLQRSPAPVTSKTSACA